ncbi:hypothetical protein LEP1GSC112_2615 [Leptospira interrogans serovar Pomona str. UT364]|nr:hypothetical protein LEP1GSC112_2615 [Leptospira interrogans serovar Pomona str. UT364]
MNLTKVSLIFIKHIAKKQISKNHCSKLIKMKYGFVSSI